MDLLKKQKMPQHIIMIPSSYSLERKLLSTAASSINSD